MASIPILLFPIKLARKFRSLTPLARRILKLRPGLQSEMEAAQLLEPPEKYIIAFIFSSLIWGVLIFLLTFMMAYNIQLETMERSLIMSAPMGIVFFFVFFFLHLIYPSIISRKVAETADRQLIYVLRDMWVQATSGVSLHRILQNISRAGYGIISEDIRDAVRKISGGEQSIVALEKVASATRSERFKRALWHITAAMRTGIGLTTALESAVHVLADEQRRSVREYGASLNFYLLIYLLFAAVIPAILTTFISLLSIFGMLAVTTEILIVVIIGSVIIQFSVVGFMKFGRPEI